MTEETQMPVTKVSEMLRITANNTIGLLTQIADHIDKLDEHIVRLEKRILELEGTPSDSEPQ
ncbi:hypothetical protein UFOVP181_200 [uncultured Caudovirales phage]|uniref:Uncharacterized protein n=1 Tax=uncultured Caudovirales phage TaxID=2100421 RepID=A0A6J7WH29_9CAUD|nr:hypothetical protein UFOVP57_439 [uncultured Caudovirales phage]CAB5208822.1 hypothetical protein UFOVP181_200 [uncultured Caudovirales phage]